MYTYIHIYIQTCCSPGPMGLRPARPSWSALGGTGSPILNAYDITSFSISTSPILKLVNTDEAKPANLALK